MLNKTTSKEFIKRINRPCDVKRNFIGIIILLIGGCVLLHSSFIGSHIWDESFYLTIPYRVLLGDALFVDEWHVSLLSSFLQYFPLWSFVKITGSTDGIILYFRILFCISQFLISILIFNKLKKYGFFAALMSALMFLLYVPEFITFLDYYTMSLMPLAIICMLLFTEEKINTYKLIFTGILTACMVVAEPTMVLMFFGYSIAVLVFEINKKKNCKEPYKLLQKKSWLFITIGVFIVFIPFMIYVLSRESISQLFSNLTNIFLSNEYSAKTLFNFDTLLSALNEYFPLAFLSLIWLVCCVMFGQENPKNKVILLYCGAILALFYAMVEIIKGLDISVCFFPFIGLFLSIGFFVLTKNKKSNFLALLCAGIGYIICLSITSEAMIAVGMYGSIISNFVLFPALFNLLNEILGDTGKKNGIKKKSEYNANIKAIPLIIILSMSIQIGIFSYCFIDGNIIRRVMLDNITDSVSVVENGIFKGIRLEQCQIDAYNLMRDDINYLESKTDEKYTIASQDATWLTLCSERAPACFTTWIAGSDIDTFEKYYKKTGINPSAIYIPWLDFHTITKNNSGATVNVEKTMEYFNNLFNCTTEKRNAGYILWVDGWKK